MLNPWRPVLVRAPAVALAMALVIALAGCATTPTPEHTSQTDPNTNLAAYRTFGWKSAAGDGVSDEPMRLLDGHIRTAIAAELARRGYTEAAADPEFLVTYDTAAQEKVKSSPFQIGIGMGSWGGSTGGSVGVSSSGVQSYQEGRLVIHVIDAKANKEVWYGTVSGKVTNKSLDAESVARAVGIAMQDFPPRS